MGMERSRQGTSRETRLTYAKVIVNPSAGAGKTAKVWPDVLATLRKSGLDFDYDLTTARGQTTEIARIAAVQGYKLVVSVGGDGTANEVANGLFQSGCLDKVALGIVATGTVCSFVRSLGIVQDYSGSSPFVIGRGSKVIDIGVVQCRNGGQLVKRFFVNEASVGFPAEIADAWTSLPGHFGHRINLGLRAIAGYGCLAIHRNKRVRLCVENEVESVSTCAIVVANGQYFADGMLIAPHANLDDQLLDMIVFEGMSKTYLLKMRPALYDGSHIGLSKVKERKIATITVESDEQLLVETDGEIIGEAPASFSLIPSALTIMV